jgi:hypothetical protein
MSTFDIWNVAFFPLGNAFSFSGSHSEVKGNGIIQSQFSIVREENQNGVAFIQGT